MGRLRIVSVKFPEELLDELDFVSEYTGLSRSEVVRRAVEEYLRVHYRSILSLRKELLRVITSG